jgi:hypothetical protein
MPASSIRALGTSAFEILEQRLDGYAGIAKQPHTADFARKALYGRTLGPIDHAHKVLQARAKGKRWAEQSTCWFEVPDR